MVYAIYNESRDNQVAIFHKKELKKAKLVKATPQVKFVYKKDVKTSNIEKLAKSMKPALTRLAKE